MLKMINLNNLLKYRIVKRNCKITSNKQPQYLECVKLFKAGWVLVEFDYIQGNAINMYWIKAKQTKSIILSFTEQQLWIRELTKLNAQNKSY